MEVSRVKARDILRGKVSRTRFRMFGKSSVQAKFLLDVSVDHAPVTLASNARVGRQGQVPRK
jgi:hypothetical protein